MKRVPAIATLACIALLSGCGMRQQLVRPTLPAVNASGGAGMAVDIQSVIDRRAPALDVSMDEKTEASNVGGFHRGGTGMELQLADGPIQSLMHEIVARAFQNAGFRIDPALSNALDVRITVTRFDADTPFNLWRAIGYANRMKAYIDADVEVTTGRGTSTWHIHGYGSNVYQMLSEENWEIALNRAIADFSTKLQAKAATLDDSANVTSAQQ